MKIISKFLSFWKKRGLRKRKKFLKERKIIYKPPCRYDYTFKIMLLGEASVGKISFTKRYCYNIFKSSERLTIGVDFHVKKVKVRGKRIKLQLWDIVGEERFRFLLPEYCLGANAVIFIYDITNSKTLDHLNDWIQIIREKAGEVPILLIGNKLYLEKSREISREEGIKIAQEYKLLPPIEISSKTGVNVKRAFEILTEKVLSSQSL